MYILLARLVAVMAVVLCSGVGRAVPEPKAMRVASPNGRLAVDFRLDADGAPRYAIRLDGKPVLRESRLGLVRDDADFSRGLLLLSTSRAVPERDRYEILTAKRRLNDYRASRKVFRLRTAAGLKMEIIFQVSDDGVACRYFFPETSAQTRRLAEEVSSFNFLPGTRAWLQPMSVAKSGWEKVNLCYEEFYEKRSPPGRLRRQAQAGCTLRFSALATPGCS